MANVTIKEATNVVTKIVRISGKTRPLQIGGKPNDENVVFLRAFDATTGEKLNTPLSITESRAKMFGFSCLTINPDAATTDANGGLVEEMNTLTNPPKYYEMSLREIPDGKVGDWGYKTKKDITVDGKQYKTGDIVPYRTVNTFVIEAIGKEYKESDFKSKELETINAKANAAGDMAYRLSMFEMLYGRKPILTNEDDRIELLKIPVTR